MNDFQRGRLVVGVVSAGKIGITLAQCLTKAGHIISFSYDYSPATRQRSENYLPEAQLVDVKELCALSELIIIAVPDDALTEVAQQLAEHVHPKCFVVHTSRRYGMDKLRPLSQYGARALTISPVTVLTEPETELEGVFCAISDTQDLNAAIAHSLVLEMGGIPLFIPDEQREDFHTAITQITDHIANTITESVNNLANIVLTTESQSTPQFRLAQALAQPLIRRTMERFSEL